MLPTRFVPYDTLKRSPVQTIITSGSWAMERFTGVRLLTRQARAPHEILRDYPTYNVPEAALILAMSRRTLQRWVSDKPYFAVAGNDQPRKTAFVQRLGTILFPEISQKTCSPE